MLETIFFQNTIGIIILFIISLAILIKSADVFTTYAEKLPFKNNSFDNVTIGFGLRNFTDRPQSLAEIYRVLRNNGRLIIIDFSKPVHPIINALNTFYLNNIVPIIARFITKNITEYRYLAKSIKEHPNQSTILKMMEGVGFTFCRYENKLNGIIAVHLGQKEK